jgi:hypothetical protein
MRLKRTRQANIHIYFYVLKHDDSLYTHNKMVGNRSFSKGFAEDQVDGMEL